MALCAALAASAPAEAGQRGEASFYGGWHHGRLMANGRPFDQMAATVAHRRLPLGTRVRVRNLSTGRAAKAVVTDRGPYRNARDGKPRVVDVSRGVAQRLGMVRQGVAPVEITVLRLARR